MITQIRRHIKFGIVLLLPAYFAILANSVLNRHTHILSGGTMIVHAHPFSKSADGEKQTNHQHSKKDFIFLQGFFIGFYETADSSFVFFNASYPTVNHVDYQCSVFKKIFLSDRSQRAPPFLV